MKRRTKAPAKRRRTKKGQKTQGGMTLLGLMQVAFGADTKDFEKALVNLKRGLKGQGR